MIHLKTIFCLIVFIAVNIIQVIVFYMERHQQILFTFCVKPNLVID